MKTLIKLLVVAALAMNAVACSKIPKPFRGTFEDPSKGVTLKLAAKKGLLTFGDGRELKTKARDLTFEALAQGQPGIFVRENSADAGLMEVYWLNPRFETVQSQEGFVWYESELIYTLLDTRKQDKVQSLTFFQCANGNVMFDSGTKALQMGCPASPVIFNLVRTK